MIQFTMSVCDGNDCLDLEFNDLVELKDKLNSIPWLVKESKVKEVFEQKADDIHQQSLHILGLNKRAWNFFNNFDMKTIADLMTYTRVDLQIFKGVGTTTLREIENSLSKLGLTLPNSVIPVEAE